MEVVKLIREKPINLIGLVENNVRINNIEKIIEKCAPGSCYIHNAHISSVSRIILCWNPNSMTATCDENKVSWLLLY